MPAAPVRSARPRRRALATRRGFARAVALTLAATVIAAACWAGRTPQSPNSLTPAVVRARGVSTPTTTGTFLADGVRISYLREGRGDVVVMLPDSAEGIDEWRSQVAALGERFLAVTYLRGGDLGPNATRDVVGGGASGAVPAAGIGTDPELEVSPSTRGSRDSRHLREFLLFVSSLTPGPVHIVGEGEGARLALRLALEYPERVRSLVVSAPDPRWVAPDAEVAAARAGTSIRASADTMLACRRLWRIHAPVLVLCGERDWRTYGDTPPLRCVRILREQVLRGAGMRPHAQASQDFNRAVARFLERQRMTAGEP